MKKFLTALIILLLQLQVSGQNPIIPVSEGITDPHIRIYDGKAYMTGCHDHSIESTWFHIDHWRMYSSADLVNWKLEYMLRPEETYIGKPYDQCWATDFIKSNDKFYWYFSEHNHGVGVMVSDSPEGPWSDPLGKPILYEGLAPTDPYDPGIVEIDGEYYIFWGVWDFYIAKLNKDMISLADEPKKIVINNPRGPYNQDGLNIEHPTDDKAFIHRYKGMFYLSWGCFYAMSDKLFGPYEYVDAIMHDSSFEHGYKEPTWPHGFKQGRHGSFFEMNSQWYFAYDDMSQTGTRYFRSSFISYVHYRDNGEIAPIRVDGTGVGRYDANKGSIEAEDYFAASEIQKRERDKGGFSIVGINQGDFLSYPNIQGLEDKSTLVLTANILQDACMEIRFASPEGELLVSQKLERSASDQDLIEISIELPELEDTTSLCFVFRGKKDNLLELESFIFK